MVQLTEQPSADRRRPPSSDRRSLLLAASLLAGLAGLAVAQGGSTGTAS